MRQQKDRLGYRRKQNDIYLVYEAAERYARVYKGIEIYARVYKAIEGYTSVYEGT